MAREDDRQINAVGFSQAQLADHVRMLQEVGFIEALIGRGPRGEPDQFQIFRLTWDGRDGHEFIAAMRDNTLWKRAKENFIKLA